MCLARVDIDQRSVRVGQGNSTDEKVLGEAIDEVTAHGFVKHDQTYGDDKSFVNVLLSLTPRTP